jgi:hypothetical protein
MTLDYYKSYLEPIFNRTIEKLVEKGYIYNDKESHNGWFKFLKDITEIKVLNADVNYKYISFDTYRDMFDNDYKRLAMLDVFEMQFKKELIRKVE